MARKLRAEIEGGLYHVITRGNNRRNIFHARTDYQKFLSLLATQKAKLPFFLYAYCLMTNHVHLLIERQAHAIGRIMHRLLTGYSQYYNRRHRRVGHLFQGRYKARLCQSDRYLSELVRYIHLNPVRAGLVDVPEEYEYSGHRAYLGLAPSGLVDVDPVLRHFGARKPQAQKRYRDFVMAGMKLGHQEEFYLGDESRILGSEEFVDATIHRIGESKRGPRPNGEPEFGDAEISRLIIAVEKSCGVPRTEFSCSSKNARMVLAKEMLIVTGHQLGANLKLLSELSGLSSGSVSRRHDAAKAKIANEAEVAKLVARITREYHLRSRIAESKA